MMKWILVIVCIAAVIGGCQKNVHSDKVCPPITEPNADFSSPVPASCPFSLSKEFCGLKFTGRHAEYSFADTWYPSWAANGNLYSPWTDGTVNDVNSNSWIVRGPVVTGNATIIGNDPLKLKIIDVNVYESSPKPYEGRYPCGSLVYNGVWYYGTYCLGPSGLTQHEGKTYNWPWLGPFVGFRYSTDYGKSWTQTPRTPAHPLFGEHSLNGEPVKIGTPHFVDFGRNIEYSPDGKAYLVAHGASDGRNRRYAYNSWGTGDQTYLIRVTPTIENINDANKYEFFAGRDIFGNARWTKDFKKIKPMAEWRDNMGCTTITYNAPLKRYLMCVTDGTDTISTFNTYILESDRITGPWKLVTYMKSFGEQAYFVNIPTKFISPDGKKMWLCYSANFTDLSGRKLNSKPAGSRYGLCLQEFELLTR